MNQWFFYNRNSLIHSRDPYDQPYKVIVHIKQPMQKDELIHYGVPGQKWGVITKEYEPVAVDHRKTSISKSVVSNLRPRTTYNVRSKSVQKREREGYYTKENGRTVWRQNGKSYSPSEKRQKIVQRALIGAGVVAGLLATYGAIRYARVQKAKAFSGILNRFISQNPGANLTTESGRNLYKKGLQLAEENSKKLSVARSTNAYLKRRHLNLNTKGAMAIYKNKRGLVSWASNKEARNKAAALIRKYRNKRTASKILKGVYGV